LLRAAQFVLVCVLFVVFAVSGEAHGASDSADPAHSAATGRAFARPTLPTAIPPNSVGVFPCNQNTTLGIESCEVRRGERLNREFDTQTAILWPLLDLTGRRELIRAQAAWLEYAADECDVQERAVLGGSILPVIGGLCLNALTQARVQDLKSAVEEYCQGAAPVGRYRTCAAQDAGIGKG
jgi:uncharacterized protein YecT (DUF1311 family)